MSNKIQEFLNDNFGSVRAFTKDETIWFVAKDITDILGLRNVSIAINGNATRKEKGIPDKHKGVFNVYTLGGNQDMLCVSEQGLYRLIFKSRKPFADELQDWICDEVLPSIRKTGGYVESNREEEFVNNTFNVNDEIKDKLIEELKAKNKQLEEENKELGHKADYWDII